MLWSDVIEKTFIQWNFLQYLLEWQNQGTEEKKFLDFTVDTKLRISSIYYSQYTVVHSTINKLEVAKAYVIFQNHCACYLWAKIVIIRKHAKYF